MKLKFKKKIENCPFCKGKAKFFICKDDEHFHPKAIKIRFACSKCFLGTPTIVNLYEEKNIKFCKKALIKDWNKRKE